MTNPARRTRNAGFTLIELMIVVVIIGILAAIAIPKFTAVSRASKEAEAPGMLKQIYTLQLRYYQKNDTYAPDLNSLEGGSALNADSKYYTFSIVSASPTFCAGAAPSAAGTAAGVSPQSIDAAGKVRRTGDCS